MVVLLENNSDVTLACLVVEREVPRLPVGGGLDVVLGAGDLEVVPERRGRHRVGALQAARNGNGGARQESADARAALPRAHRRQTQREKKDCVDEKRRRGNGNGDGKATHKRAEERSGRVCA